MEKVLIEFLSQFVTSSRLELFKSVLEERTDYITVVLEDIFHPHNASAVLRSCDCFGVQDVHILENRHTYNVNPDVALGASKWLTLHRYHEVGKNNTTRALLDLKNQGYRIVATVPDRKAESLHSFDVHNGPFSLVFGGEKTGVSGEVRKMADHFVTIPMVGFTESLNISVAAAIMLQHFTEQIRKNIVNRKLSEDKYNRILLDWIRKSVKRVDIIEKDFLTRLSRDVE
ncbi:TrmH family RNA methyltransferase [Marinilabilia salmonicolor]|nr:RNA methyltransferase [Marinilabilia salmonicolor]